MHLITLIKAPFHLGVSVSQHAEYQGHDTGALKCIVAIVNDIQRERERLHQQCSGAVKNF